MKNFKLNLNQIKSLHTVKIIADEIHKMLILEIKYNENIENIEFTWFVKDKINDIYSYYGKDLTDAILAYNLL